MHLAIIRHAIAKAGEDDTARPLSERGRKRFAYVVAGLGQLGQHFDLLLHSPKLRAVETAELLAPLTKRFAVTALLAAPPGPALLEALSEPSMALVGHEPHLSTLVAWLTTGDAEATQGLELKKGGVALLRGKARPQGMRLTALLPPRVLRHWRA
jgi:phosphohistidine phosphatase